MGAIDELKEKAWRDTASLTSLEYSVWRLNLLGTEQSLQKSIWDARRAATELAALRALVEAARLQNKTWHSPTVTEALDKYDKAAK